MIWILELWGLDSLRIGNPQIGDYSHMKRRNFMKCRIDSKNSEIMKTREIRSLRTKRRSFDPKISH
jgi:hypothetical protein